MIQRTLWALRSQSSSTSSDDHQDIVQIGKTDIALFDSFFWSLTLLLLGYVTKKSNCTIPKSLFIDEDDVPSQFLVNVLFTDGVQSWLISLLFLEGVQSWVSLLLMDGVLS